MKKTTKIWILAIVPLLLLLTWYLGENIAIKIAVNNQCNQFTIGDDWVGCVIELSLEKNDAKYCRSEGIFSPYPGLCMEKFAQKTQDKESCGTITKSRYKEECLERFKSSTTAKFVSEKQFEENLQNQLKMTPQTLQQLSISNDTQLKLEFFFYTNSNAKATQLANELKSLTYDVDFGVTEMDENLLVITGWTTKIKMDEQTVLKWTEDMTRLGYKYDTEFDGWGTNPKQK